MLVIIAQRREGLGEALFTDITHQAGRGLTLAVEIGDRLEERLIARDAAISPALDEHHDRLAVRRRILKRLLL
jgi:hypothetical protein